MNLMNQKLLSKEARRSIKDDPIEYLKKLGYKIDQDIKVVIKQNTKNIFYVVMVSGTTVGSKNLSSISAAGTAGSVGTMGCVATAGTVSGTVSSASSIGTIGTAGSGG